MINLVITLLEEVYIFIIKTLIMNLVIYRHGQAILAITDKSV